MTCHASIVSRELGIPCIVGTKSRGEAATVTIPDGIDVTIDATHGVVYEGIIEEAKKENQAGAAVAVAEYFPPTGTKVYMNLGDPELAEKYSSLPCDGIGLMREEFIWTTYIHEHPCISLKPDILKSCRSAGRRYASGLSGNGSQTGYSAFQRFQIQ